MIHVEADKAGDSLYQLWERVFTQLNPCVGVVEVPHLDKLENWGRE
jgi:hypothetical protein